MKSWEMLFNEFSSALQFPYYFGENLNAFDDCMGDLEWISEDKIIIFIDKWCSVLDGSKENKDIFLNHIVENEKYLESSSNKKKLRTILLLHLKEKSTNELKSIDVLNDRGSELANLLR